MSPVAVALGPDVPLEVTCRLLPHMFLAGSFGEPFWVLGGLGCSWLLSPLCWGEQGRGHPRYLSQASVGVETFLLVSQPLKLLEPLSPFLWQENCSPSSLFYTSWCRINIPGSRHQNSETACVSPAPDARIRTHGSQEQSVCCRLTGVFGGSRKPFHSR